MTSFSHRPGILALSAVLILGHAAQRCVRAERPTPDPAERILVEALETLRSSEIDSQQRARAYARYRQAVASLLPAFERHAKLPDENDQARFFSPHFFSGMTPVSRPATTESGLYREGLGLPLIGRMQPSWPADPNAPRIGYRVAVTALIVPEPSGRLELLLADPQRLETIEVLGSTFPVAMDLEAIIEAAEEVGPRFGDGLRYMLRSNQFERPSQLTFFQPFDPAKTPVVLVHGLMSTPRMWRPVLRGLLAERAIRERYQFWFFFYPTGQPVPLSALQLREALTEAASHHQLRKRVVLIGHSMGGILVRAQVSRIAASEAEEAMPGVASLPTDSLARSALIFEPRNDVSQVIFIATPHRGSRVAAGGIGALGIHLIELPDQITSELESFSEVLVPGGETPLPTSIHGLSPNSKFLQALDRYRPAVPSHSIIGIRRSKTALGSSDGIVPYSSSHLEFTDSEVLIPSGHGGFSHPQAIAEVARILMSAQQDRELN